MLEKLQTLVARISYWQTSNYKRIKNKEPFVIKLSQFSQLMVAVSRLEKTLGDNWTH